MTSAATTQADNPRRARGLALYQRSKARIRPIVDGKYLVPSATSGTDYVVDVDERRCTCPDHTERLVACKHFFAVMFLREEVTTPDGSIVVTESVQVVRKTYAQSSWSAYHRGQCEEVSTAKVLLKSLVAGVEEPVRIKSGRKPIARADALFAATMKVYGTMSARRSDSAIRNCEEDGFLSCSPSFNSVLRTIDKPEMTPILQALIEESARPLVGLESKFAIDATGFATQSYVRWFDHRHGKDTRVQQWRKAHVVVGTRSNIITAAVVTDGYVHDTVKFPELVEATVASGFNVVEMSADKGYLSHTNLTLAEALGMTPFIPLKSNSRGTGSPAMKRLAHAIAANEQEFLAHYHARSNVESTFSALKRKFGENLRSKNPDAQVNEVLLKCLSFNLSRLVHAIHTFGVEPKFWGGVVTQ
jgi:transposase